MMKRLIMLAVVALVSGCASIEYGPLKVRTFGTEVNLKAAEWAKRDGTGTVEAVRLEGYQRDEVKTTSKALDIIGMIAGGLIGSAGGPATAAGGAVAGGGIMEILQKATNAIKGGDKIEPTPTPAPDANTPATVTPPPAVTGQLCDPPADYMAKVAADPGGEECRIEPQTGLMVRYLVWIPSRNTWWAMSSLGLGHVRRDGGNLVADTFAASGITIAPRGFRYGHEPESYSDPTPKLDVTGSSCPYTGERIYVMAECRK